MNGEESYPEYSPTTGEPLPSDVKTMAMLCHLISLTVYVTYLGGILGPLIVWLIKKDAHPFIDEHGKEALNFNISVFIWSIIGAILLFCFFIGLVILIPLSIFHIVMTIVATIKANNGEHFRYPLTFRLVK